MENSAEAREFPANLGLPELGERDTLEGILECAVAKRLDHVLVALIPRLGDEGPWGVTPLHLASAIRSADKLQELLHHFGKFDAIPRRINVRINPDSRVWAEFTPLHVAVRYGQIETVQLLLSYGADLIAVATRMTPLHLAHTLGNERMLDVLLSRIDNTSAENLVDRNMVSHLHLASSRGHSGTARTLLRAGASVDARIPSKSPVWPGLRPLGIGVRYARFRVVKVLLEHCADTRELNREARRIIRRRSQRIIDRLVQDGCYRVDLEPAVRGQESLLQYACRRGYVGLTKVLLRHGAPVNFGWDGDATPLRLAMVNGHEIIVRLLLASGADPRALGPGGFDALDALVGSTENFNWRRGSSTPRRLDSIEKLRRYYVRMIDAFLRVGMTNEDINRALRHSIGNASATWALLEHGADVNAEDACGKSALWHHLHANQPMTPSVYLVFRRHLRRMSFLRMPVSQQNLQLCILEEIRLEPEELQDVEINFVRTSEEERQSLMNEFLEDERTSLYDIMRKSPEELERVCHSGTLRKVIDSDDFHDKFPIYGFLLRRQCNRISQLS